jgi:hypothetical protein
VLAAAVEAAAAAAVLAAVAVAAAVTGIETQKVGRIYFDPCHHPAK